MISVPQDLVSMIVSKAVKMTKKMNVRLLGVVENMSYIICEDCGKKLSCLMEKVQINFYKKIT